MTTATDSTAATHEATNTAVIPTPEAIAKAEADKLNAANAAGTSTVKTPVGADSTATPETASPETKSDATTVPSQAKMVPLEEFQKLSNDKAGLAREVKKLQETIYSQVAEAKKLAETGVLAANEAVESVIKKATAEGAAELPATDELGMEIPQYQRDLYKTNRAIAKRLDDREIGEKQAAALQAKAVADAALAAETKAISDVASKYTDVGNQLIDGYAAASGLTAEVVLTFASKDPDIANFIEVLNIPEAQNLVLAKFVQLSHENRTLRALYADAAKGISLAGDGAGGNLAATLHPGGGAVKGSTTETKSTVDKTSPFFSLEKKAAEWDAKNRK